MVSVLNDMFPQNDVKRCANTVCAIALRNVFSRVSRLLAMSKVIPNQQRRVCELGNKKAERLHTQQGVQRIPFQF